MKRIFSFEFPLKKKVVRDLRIVTIEVGTLLIEGTGTLNNHIPVTNPYDRYVVEIESVMFKGQDILPVLDWSDSMDLIEEAAIKHFASVCEASSFSLSLKQVVEN